jgi:hypothetical protein
MRVLVTGGRGYRHEATVSRTLWALADLYGKPIDVIIHGGCGGMDSEGALYGADVLAQFVAEDMGVETKVYVADWETHGKAAGPIRNQLMIDDGKPDLVVAFPGGTGTADMVRRAKAAGIEVMEVK